MFYLRKRHLSPGEYYISRIKPDKDESKNPGFCATCWRHYKELEKEGWRKEELHPEYMDVLLKTGEETQEILNIFTTVVSNYLSKHLKFSSVSVVSISLEEVIKALAEENGEYIIAYSFSAPTVQIE